MLILHERLFISILYFIQATGGELLMKNLQNESKVDRIIRIIAGLLIFSLSYAYFSGTLQIIGYILAIILVFTGLTGFCLIYKILKIKTN